MPVVSRLFQKSAGCLSPYEVFYIVWEKDIFPCYNGNVNIHKPCYAQHYNGIFFTEKYMSHIDMSWPGRPMFSLIGGNVLRDHRWEDVLLFS